MNFLKATIIFLLLLVNLLCSANVNFDILTTAVIATCSVVIYCCARGYAHAELADLLAAQRVDTDPRGLDALREKHEYTVVGKLLQPDGTYHITIKDTYHNKTTLLDGRTSLVVGPELARFLMIGRCFIRVGNRLIHFSDSHEGAGMVDDNEESIALVNGIDWNDVDWFGGTGNRLN